MKLLQFEKWFFDILTPDNDYIIMFHTVTRFLFFRVSILEVHVSGAEHHYSNTFSITLRNVKGHNLVANEGSILFEGHRCFYFMQKDDLEINLEIHLADPDLVKWPIMTIGRSPKSQIQWSPIWMKAAFNGKIKAGRELQIEQSKGYIDYLISNFMPFKVPVTSLYWGRLHHDKLDMTYSCAFHKHGSGSTNMVIIRNGDEILVFEDCFLDAGSWYYSGKVNMEVPESYTLTGQNKNSRVKIKVEHLEPAILFQFIDNSGFMGNFKNRIIKWLARDPKGIKFHAIGTVELDHNGGMTVLNNNPMISEYIRFIYSKKK